MLPRSQIRTRSARTSRTRFDAPGLQHLEPRTLLSAGGVGWEFVGPVAGEAADIVLPISPSIEPQAASAESWSSLIRLDEFRADSRFAGIDGTGFTSVIIDGGADLDHPFFGDDDDANGVADRIVYQYDFANNDASASAVADHGSNVTSIVGSEDATYPGVAPASALVVLKVFTDAGTGNFAMVESALRWVVDNVHSYNISSVNLSLGDNQNHPAHIQRYGIADELGALTQLNVKVTASAGNSFYTFNSQVGVSYPAADPNVLGVGAVFATSGGSYRADSGATAYTIDPDRIAPFSQRELSLTSIFAPGVGITGANHAGGIVTMSGTSQAAPIVAGLALLADQLAASVLGRRLTYAEFRSIITTTGTAIIDGDDENDNVDNSNLRFLRVDAMAMGEAILAMADVGAPNRGPTMASVAPMTRAIPGRPYVLTYERLLAASNAGDADGDTLTFRVESVLTGSLFKGGVPVTPGVTTLVAGERLIWKPAAVRVGRTDAFTILAFDGLELSTGAVAVGIISGPTVFGITSRVDRDNRGSPSPTTSTSVFSRGGTEEPGASRIDTGLDKGWSNLVNRHRRIA